jgi:hypothetical protein
MSDTTEERTIVLSYMTLRKVIGGIGFVLPLVLAIGVELISRGGILSSVSSYYWSVMGDVFVGSLFAIGVFFWAYRVYGQEDIFAAQVAAYSALGVALFPTAPPTAVPYVGVVANLHLAFAFIFFSALVYFDLFLFTKTHPGVEPSPQKRKRNRVYIICGYTMVVMMLLLFALRFLPDGSAIGAYHPIFWVETILIEAFGISWLVKGEAVLKDIAPS